MGKGDSLKCILCGQKTRHDKVISCNVCNAVNYCSTEHMKLDRGNSHNSETCHRLKEQMQRKDFDGMDFPWYPKEPMDSQCDLLNQFGLHDKGAWSKECQCSKSTAFGAHAPLLRSSFLTAGKKELIMSRRELAESLKSWWRLDEGVDLMTKAYSGDFMELCDWKTYAKERGLELESPLYILLDMPLTMLLAMQRFKKLKGSLPGQIRILCVGAEKEADLWPVFLELGALIPHTDIIIHMIGPELPSWLDGKSVVVQSPVASTDPNQTGSVTKLQFHHGTLEDNLMSLGMVEESNSMQPDILVGLNAGLGAYPQWMDALGLMRFFMQHKGKPQVMLFTDYMEESLQISRKNLYILFGPLRDCPDIPEGLACIGYNPLMEIDISSRIQLSECWVNPFRKPTKVKSAMHRVPYCPNGFGCFIQLS